MDKFKEQAVLTIVELLKRNRLLNVQRNMKTSFWKCLKNRTEKRLRKS